MFLMKPQSGRIIIQVAHVVRDLEKAISAYSRVFDVGPWDVYTFAPPTLRESMYLGKSSDHTYILNLRSASSSNWVTMGKSRSANFVSPNHQSNPSDTNFLCKSHGCANLLDRLLSACCW